MNIGMNIKNRREKLGITQKQMAENLSLAQPMIAQIERGTKIPNMILGLAIARMLGCTMEDLVEDANDDIWMILAALSIGALIWSMAVLGAVFEDLALLGGI